MRRQARVPWLPSVVRCAALALVGIAAVALVTPTHAATERVTVVLKEVDLPGVSSVRGVSGTAVLTAAGEGTTVSMKLEGRGVTGNHPTHIHTGTCKDFNPNPTFPLTTVNLDPVDDTGVSETTVQDVSLDELLTEDYVILVHKSAEELTTYLVCGDIKESARAVPTAGIGTAASAHRARGMLLIGLGALASALAAGALLHRASRPGLGADSPRIGD